MNSEEYGWLVYLLIFVKEVYSYIKDSEFDCKIVKIKFIIFNVIVYFFNRNWWMYWLFVFFIVWLLRFCKLVFLYIEYREIDGYFDEFNVNSRSFDFFVFVGKEKMI